MKTETLRRESVSAGARALARHLERPVHILEARVDSGVRLHGVLGVAELEQGESTAER